MPIDFRHRPSIGWLAASFLAIPIATAAIGSQGPAKQVPSSVPEQLAEWVEVDRVVDGDTIHVRRAGRLEKLRLLSVDSEERLGRGHSSSPTKPQTVFGEECALWAERVFAALGEDGAPARIRLVFPDGIEERDAFGRLLCHVLLPDGTNYNLKLVRVGRSPYFNKYGNDRIEHAAFAAAQTAAREAQVGIWNPATNEAKTPAAPSAKRPYAELLAWWDARAAAIDGYRARETSEPDRIADAGNPDSLARAERSAKELEVFGEVDRVFDEKNGERTVLLATSDRERALRIRIPLSQRESHEAFRVESMAREFRQNYVWVRGRVERGRSGFEIRSGGPDRWRRAGPEPGLPAPSRSR